MKKCIVFGAGEYDGQTPVTDGDTVIIAADAGIERCIAAGLVPDHVIGDFDSLGHVPAGENVLRLPVEKDVTDTDAAAALALRLGCEEIRFYGAAGGRPDHTLANISLVARLAEKGIGAFMYGAGYEITAVKDGTLTVRGEPGKTVSVFSWTDVSRGVTLKGLKYPLEGAELTNTFALGVSNSLIGETAEVSVGEGLLVVMIQR